MARKTVIGDEIEERIDYFTDWVDRLSNDDEKRKVVNERTARELIVSAFSRDNNLNNLLSGMEREDKGFKTLIKSSYFNDLIEANRTGKELDAAVGRLKARRKSLEQLLPRTTRKKNMAKKGVIDRFSKVTILRKYGITKASNGRYRDTKTGRYASFDRVLKITDAVILNTAKKRRELEKYLSKFK